MTARKLSMSLLLGMALSCLGACQRAAEDRSAAGNVNGNQAIGRNPNAMGSAGLPPTNMSPNSVQNGVQSNGSVRP